MTTRTLLKGGCVLTLGSKLGNFPLADVLIDGAVVAEVGPGLRARDAEVIDAEGTIIMPGFVDTHRHAWKSLFRNIGGEAPMPPEEYGHHYGPDDVYAATLIGLLGALEAGISTVVDWSDIHMDQDATEAALQAHADAGLRTVLVHSPRRWATSPEAAGTAVRRLIAGDGVADAPLTTIAFGSPEPSGHDLERTAADWGMARELGLRIHAHAGTDSSSRGALAALAEGGLLGEDVTLVHCTHLEHRDLDAVASSGASVSLTPSSEMATRLGSPPVQRLIDRGIRPGLGVDDERIAPGDMFAQMRAAISLQHAELFELKLAGKAGLPGLLSTRQVIRYATVDGAKVAGLGAVTGSIEPGKQADIVVLRADRPNIFPINDPIGAVVWGMDTSNVDWVFVAGSVLVRGGALVVDVARARKLAISAQRRVATAAGPLIGVGGPR